MTEEVTPVRTYRTGRNCAGRADAGALSALRSCPSGPGTRAVALAFATAKALLVVLCTS